MKKQTKNMTEGTPLILILQFALPLLAGNLFQQLYNMVDAIIVGRFLGPRALAGVGASSSVQFLVIGFCLGICSGFAIPVAQRFGAGDYTDMRKYIFHGIIVTAAVAVVVTTLTAIYCPQILNLMRTPSDIYQDAYTYLLIIFLGIPFTLLYNFLAGVLRAIGNSRTPFYFLVFSTLLNIVLDVLFIVVFGMGVAGAGLATVIAQAASGVLCFLLIKFKYEILRLKREDCKWNQKHFQYLVAMGVPMGLQYSITAIGSMVLQATNNDLPAVEESMRSVYVSAFAAGSKIKQLTMCPFDALANSVSTFASQNYGAGKADRIKKGVRQGVAIGMLYGLLIGIVMIFFGRGMSTMFIKLDADDLAFTTAVLDASGLYLRRLGMFYWSLGILNVTRMTVQGLGYSAWTLFSGISEMIARIVVSLCFAPIFGFGAITFADQAAWLSAVAYILPACIHFMNKVAKQLEGQQNSSIVAE